MDFCYIGIKPCVCVVGAIVDCEDTREEIPDTLYQWSKAGLTIERIDLDSARQLLTFSCPHEGRQLPLFEDTP